MKKICCLLCFLLAVVMSFSMTACIPTKPEDDSVSLDDIDITADENYSGTLKIRTWSEETEKAIMEAYIDGFQKKYPYIKIDYDTYYLDQYYATLRNDFGVCATKNDYSDAVDLFWIGQDNITSFYDLDLMFPLTEIDRIDDGFDQADLVEEAVETCVVGENMYIMPRDFSQVVMYFNQDIFDIAGVDYPTHQMSREAFVKMLDDLRAGIDASDAKNDYGNYYRDVTTYLIDVNAMWDSWAWPLVKSFGGQVIDENGEAALDSEEVYSALAFWKSLREKNYVGPISTSNVGVNFRMQQSAIYFHTRSVMSNIYLSDGRNIKGVQNLGVTSLPQFGDIYTIASGASGYSMYKHSEHKTEAWLFLKYIASEEGQNIFCSTGNGIPSLKSLLNAEDSAWRSFDHEALGTAFDNDAFVYGMDFPVRPYTNTREFFKYLDVSRQKSALECLQTCFLHIDDENVTEASLREAIANQNKLLDKYIHSK